MAKAEPTNQRVEFRHLHMECCGHQLCWVNPRYPSYCPNCGKGVFPAVRGWATAIDQDAVLRLNV